MGIKLRYLIFCVWIIVMGTSNAQEFSDLLNPDYNPSDTWVYRSTKKDLEQDVCSGVHPTSRDIVRRIYAILPFFDREHENKAFLHKYRATIHGMSEGDDLLDREASYYAAALTPLVFLQQSRDTWCLLERFHRAIRLYQISHPTEKRSALKILQNFRAVSHKNFRSVSRKVINTVEVAAYRQIETALRYSVLPLAESPWKYGDNFLSTNEFDVEGFFLALVHNNLVQVFVRELPGPASRPYTTTYTDFEDEEIHDKKDIRYLKELIKNLG